MTASPIVKFDQVTKIYRRGRQRSNLRLAIPGRAGASVTGDTHTALQDVSFSVEPGRALGIVGHNGAGKSTLLKLASRVIAPTSGSVHVDGRVTALIELGTGFHPEMTGRENVEFAATVLGMHRSDLRSRFADIVEFADIGAFIDTPVKRYSSGMLARLGFGVASHLDSDILVVDEVLSVGDAQFQRRCHERIAHQRRNGCAILYVTHQLWTVPIVCDHAMVLDGGSMILSGTPTEVINAYLATASTTAPESGHILTRVEADRATILPNDPLTLTIEHRVTEPDCYVMVSIVGVGDRVHWSASSAGHGSDSAGMRAVTLSIDSLPLQPGRYELYFSYLANATSPVVEDHRRLILHVEGPDHDVATYGPFALRSSWSSAGIEITDGAAS